MRTRNNRLAAGTVLAALLLTLAACDTAPEITSEQAGEAFFVAFGSAYVGSMAAQFGQPLPGITIGDDGTVTFEEFDVTELDTDYTAISGTVTADSSSAQADFTLAGGPVETIAFDVTADQFAADDALETTVVVNGTEMAIRLDPDERLR